MRKQGEKEVDLGEKVLDLSKAQSGAVKNMLWEIATSHEGTPNFKAVLTPSLGSNIMKNSPLSLSVELGPLAMGFD